MAVDEVIEQINELNVLELVELKEKLEEQWGVEAMAPMVAAAAPAGAEAGGAAHVDRAVVVMMRPATQHLVLPRRGPLGIAIRTALIVVRIEPVSHPLPDVASHVRQAVRAVSLWRVLTPWCRVLIATL